MSYREYRYFGHECGGLLMNHRQITSRVTKKIVIHGNECIILFLTRYLMYWTHNSAKNNHRSLISPLLVCANARICARHANANASICAYVNVRMNMQCEYAQSHSSPVLYIIAFGSEHSPHTKQTRALHLYGTTANMDANKNIWNILARLCQVVTVICLRKCKSRHLKVC